ncbi:hypothetical protein FHS43_000550 [Streptosporangium becharense]|uniref:Uncharacterized protein n=1 Tax=Streptosporangium becharense TaxID=1816182 RepID=A0A7W9IPA4_9ACTN|nr:hypothetical protein [Streptosporangium becharense]MBB2909304.1 hypothetical protein [Streptosporangium becharense]MBB5823793.1 hypothetical protein [Streptosporangium becharense]
MTYPLCEVPGCSRPSPDGAAACVSCGAELHQHLAEVADADGLAAELDTALARQARLGGGGRRGAETPLGYGEAAAEAIAVLRSALAGWVRVLDRHGQPVGPACPSRCGHGSCAWITTRILPKNTLPAMAAWLADRIPDLRRHPAGGEAVDELGAAIRHARNAIDRGRGAELVYCGPCSHRGDDGRTCMTDLYARPGARLVQCRCGAITDVRARRAWLLREAEGVLGTAAEIARALTRLDRPVTPERVRQWAQRGLLLSRGRGDHHHPLYRVGDVLALLEGLEAVDLAGPACARCRHQTCRRIRAARPSPPRAA